MSENGEKAEPPSLGEVADFKMTLKIWDVPPELGRKFIGIAKASYANKSWLLLQDLMMKAEKYDLWMSSGKMAEIEAKIKEHEERIALIEGAINEVAERAESQEAEEQRAGAKTPKTFGGA